MFSATFPEGIQIMARDFLQDYVYVNTGNVGGTNPDILQEFIEVQRKDEKD